MKYLPLAALLLALPLRAQSEKPKHTAAETAATLQALRSDVKTLNCDTLGTIVRAEDGGWLADLLKAADDDLIFSARFTVDTCLQQKFMLFITYGQKNETETASMSMALTASEMYGIEYEKRRILEKGLADFIIGLNAKAASPNATPTPSAVMTPSNTSNSEALNQYILLQEMLSKQRQQFPQYQVPAPTPTPVVPSMNIDCTSRAYAGQVQTNCQRN